MQLIPSGIRTVCNPFLTCYSATKELWSEVYHGLENLFTARHRRAGFGRTDWQ
jgi:hypothetical protein